LPAAWANVSAVCGARLAQGFAAPPCSIRSCISIALPSTIPGVIEFAGSLCLAPGCGEHVPRRQVHLERPLWRQVVRAYFLRWLLGPISAAACLRASGGHVAQQESTTTTKYAPQALWLYGSFWQRSPHALYSSFWPGWSLQLGKVCAAPSNYEGGSLPALAQPPMHT
jgi:hypothetical protein